MKRTEKIIFSIIFVLVVRVVTGIELRLLVCVLNDVY